MLTNNSPNIKKARRLLSQYMQPNIIKYVELQKPCRSFSKMIRVIIAQQPNGQFATGVMRVGHKMDIYATTYTPDTRVSSQRFFAEEKLEELVTVSEQEGYECSDEFDAPIHNVCATRYKTKRPCPLQGIAFYHANQHNADKYLCQPVPGGLHVLVKVDAFGAVCVHDFNSVNVAIDKESLIVGRVKTYLQPLIQRDGFRGALLEAYFDGVNVYVVDAGYIHNKSLFKTPFEKRMTIIDKYLAPIEQEEGCRFIYPKSGNPNQWLQTYRFGLTKGALIKHRLSLFCVQPTEQFEDVAKYMQSGFMLTEAPVISCMGNYVQSFELSLSNANNVYEKLTVPYPSRDYLVRGNEYTIIGYDEMLEDVPVIL